MRNGQQPHQRPGLQVIQNLTVIVQTFVDAELLDGLAEGVGEGEDDGEGEVGAPVVELLSELVCQFQKR